MGQARESDRKQGRGKLKERDALIKDLREQLEKKDAELQAKSMEVRDMCVFLCVCVCLCVCVRACVRACVCERERERVCV